jgi:hypothetical protein
VAGEKRGDGDGAGLTGGHASATGLSGEFERLTSQEAAMEADFQRAPEFLAAIVFNPMAGGAAKCYDGDGPVGERPAQPSLCPPS